MNIVQFIRILWVHRFLTLMTTAATLIGAAAAVIFIPPSYEGTTRIMLNILKPDAVTGEMIATNSARTFVVTQIELIRDYAVAGQAVEKLGWLSDPNVIAQYEAEKADGDVKRALSQRIIDRTRVNNPGATNILEIQFRGSTADDSRMMANALREAYIETTISSRRQQATRNADWYTQQAEKESILLAEAETAKTNFERQSGIVMQDDKTDIETARLRALSAQSSLGGAMVTPQASVQSSPAAIQLAQLDAQIGQASKTLGPNHPTMLQMKLQRSSLAKVVAEDQASAQTALAASSRSMSQSATAVETAVRNQTARVIANRDKIENLNQLQTKINLHRAQVEKSLARASDLRQEAAIADSGVTVLSEAITPRDPAFPNKPLIFGGALGLGGAMGLSLSLLLELLRRRVRGVEDLMQGIDVPMLAAISRQAVRAPAKPKRGKFMGRKNLAVPKYKGA